MVVRAIYENGVFRPHEPVDIPDRTEVILHPEVVPSAPPGLVEFIPPDDPRFAHLDPGLARVYSILSRRYDDGGPPTNALETHNDHQP